MEFSTFAIAYPLSVIVAVGIGRAWGSYRDRLDPPSFEADSHLGFDYKSLGTMAGLTWPMALVILGAVKAWEVFATRVDGIGARIADRQVERRRIEAMSVEELAVEIERRRSKGGGT